MYSELLKNAETFFVDADKHNLCWDDSKEDHIKKTELRDVAYQSRKSFEQNWINVSEQVKNIYVEQNKFFKTKLRVAI